mmetsp:Transcript_51901/g.59242  ORF Transcript_51901/g.59242 Transcript_51901/m.59242 type:complete len:150 (-) Transcript_51901:66-515(-)
MENLKKMRDVEGEQAFLQKASEHIKTAITELGQRQRAQSRIPGSCPKCGKPGHLSFQCMNFLDKDHQSQEASRELLGADIEERIRRKVREEMARAEEDKPELLKMDEEVKIEKHIKKKSKKKEKKHKKEKKSKKEKRKHRDRSRSRSRS